MLVKTHFRFIIIIILILLITFYYSMNASKEVKKDVEMTSSDQQQTFQNYKLDILLSSSSYQNQNGVRLNDYNRYSHFCGKKINKLRKLLKITQGKRKFGKIPIDVEVAQKANDNR